MKLKIETYTKWWTVWSVVTVVSPEVVSEAKISSNHACEVAKGRDLRSHL